MNSGTDYKARETDIAQPVMTTPVGGNQGGDYVVQPMAVDVYNGAITGQVTATIGASGSPVNSAGRKWLFLTSPTPSPSVAERAVRTLSIGRTGHPTRS